MKKKLIAGFSLVLGFSPFMVFAQQSTACANVTPGTIQAIICKIGSILNIIIPILIVLGVVFFVYGVVTYVVGSDEEAKKKGRDRMIYGIIGLVVIVSMWGRVGVVTKTFGLDANSTTINLPTLPIGN
jgi:hypothetical protein